MSQIDSDDIPTNTSANPHFNDIVATAPSRRSFMRRGLGLGAVGFFGSSLLACGGGEGGSPAVAKAGDAALDETVTLELAGRGRSPLGFEPVVANSLDTITVPAGYRSAVLCRWGDPLFPPNTSSRRTSSRGAPPGPRTTYARASMPTAYRSPT